MDHVDALTALVIGMADGPSAAAQHHYEAGNRDARSMQALPPPPDHAKAGRMLSDPEKRLQAEYLRGLGIVWHLDKPIRGGLLYECTLPGGWSVVSAGHYLYSHLIDAKGRIRAQIMVHNQDRDSWIAPSRRFTASVTQDNHVDAEGYFPAIFDSGKAVWRGQVFAKETAAQGKRREQALQEAITKLRVSQSPEAETSLYDAIRELQHSDEYGDPYSRVQRQACAKLAELLPDHDKIEAYWDSEPVLPPSESKAPVGSEYDCQYGLYDAETGTHVDSSYETHKIVAKDDAEAIARYTKWVGDMARRYRIKANITKDGQRVHSFEVCHVKIERQCFNPYDPGMTRRRRSIDGGFY